MILTYGLRARPGLVDLLSKVDSALIFPLACCAVVVLGVGYKVNSFFSEKKRVAEVERTGIGRGAKGEPNHSTSRRSRPPPSHSAAYHPPDKPASAR